MKFYLLIKDTFFGNKDIPIDGTRIDLIDAPTLKLFNRFSGNIFGNVTFYENEKSKRWYDLFSLLKFVIKYNHYADCVYIKGFVVHCSLT